MEEIFQLFYLITFQIESYEKRGANFIILVPLQSVDQSEGFERDFEQNSIKRLEGL